MRVLHVDGSCENRGGQAQLAYLLQHDPTAAVVLRRRSPLRRRVQRQVFDFGRGFFRALRSFHPDLIAAHTSTAHDLALLQWKVPVVVHRRLDFRVRNSLKYRAVNGVIAVSQAVKSVVIEAGVEPQRIRVVRDGVDSRVGQQISRPSAPLLLAVGALVPHKDHSTLIEAVRDTCFQLWIAGIGPLRRTLEEQSRGLDVRFLGHRDDIPDLLATADVFVHPSTEEGLGQVVLEARAAGARIVAARAGGIPEVIGDGLLYTPRDAQGLRAAIQHSLTLPRPQPFLAHEYRASTMAERTTLAYASLL